MKWYQWQYRGPYWLWAVIVVTIYALVITVFEELASGPAATITVEEVAGAHHSPQE